MQVAAALCARHIGGAVNYVGVAETLEMGRAAQAAGLAADNLLCALYFATLFHLARHIPPDAGVAAQQQPDPSQDDTATAAAAAVKPGIQVGSLWRHAASLTPHAAQRLTDHECGGGCGIPPIAQVDMEPFSSADGCVGLLCESLHCTDGRVGSQSSCSLPP